MTDLAAPRPDARPAIIAFVARLAPGLGLAAGVALAAMAVQRLSGIPALSPLVVAMLIGAGIRNLAGPIPVAAPGIAFSLKRILRFAIVLLGFKLTLAQLAAIGLPGALVVVTTLSATFVFTKLMARVLGVEPRLGELIAAGTSVCGASAVIACNTVTRGSDEDVAYAIACVTLFGSLSMVLMPVLAEPLGLAARNYGIWVGATVHEVAQVAGAAFARGEISGQAGTVAKLSRVVLLAPLILILGRFAAARARGEGAEGPGVGRAPTPWFVFGFLAVVALNSLVTLPEGLSRALATGTDFLLTWALAAMGLETDLRRLRLKGLRPLVLGALAWAFISLFGLGLVLTI